MSRKQLYKTLATVSGLVGVGMIIGHSLSSGTATTAIWLGGILILAAALLLGMSISLSETHVRPKTSDRDDNGV